MNQPNPSNLQQKASLFNAKTSQRVLDYIRRQILAITDLQGTESKPEIVDQLSYDKIWLQFWEFATLAGAEFGWSIELCCGFKVYDIYKLQSELEKRSYENNLVLSTSVFPTWLLTRDDHNKLLHEQTYPFYEVKIMFMHTPIGLTAFFKRMLNAGGLPDIPMQALQNQSAAPFWSEGTNY